MASLIGFDNNRENIQFKDHCKLSINFVSNYLYVEPENEEFKLISASFKWNFVMKKNLLFVFAEHDFQDFCLVFRNEQICKKTFDYIKSGKKRDITEPQTEHSIDTSFINPIFQAISNNPTLNYDLIETIGTWHQLLDEKDKEMYNRMMKEYGIFDVITAAVPSIHHPKQEIPLLNINNRKRKHARITTETSEKDMEDFVPTKFSKIITSTMFQLIDVLRLSRRKLLIFTSEEMNTFHEYQRHLKSKNPTFMCITCNHKAIVDINEAGKICVKMESKKHQCKPSTKIPENYNKLKILQKPAYEIFDNRIGKSEKILVIFDSDDRSLCYEYFLSNINGYYYCLGCQSKFIPKRKLIKAKICNEGMKAEYLEIFDEHHGCKKRKFQPEKYNIVYDYVLKPYFEIHKFSRKGKEGQTLVIFDQNDRTKCYYYFNTPSNFCCRECDKMGKIISAKLRQNSEGEEYVILSMVKHVCELKPYISNKKDVLHQDVDFEIMEETKGGKPRIFVFVAGDRSKCHIFINYRVNYSCVGCYSTNNRIKRETTNDKVIRHVVTGNLIKDEKTGKYSFEMKPNQTHCCEPRPYQPEMYECISKTYDYFYFNQQIRKKILRLGIISPKDNQFCFIFKLQTSNQYFFCIECKKKKCCVQIKLQKDADGKEYFNHDIKKHICKPVKISSISKSDILKDHGLTFESKKKSKFDESKILRMPDFQLCPNNDGVADKKLIVFHPTDKTLCYHYWYDQKDKAYLCGRCKTLKKYISAKLHKDESDAFIVPGKNDHVCEPIKYEPPINIEDKIIKHPNFELRPNQAGVPNRRLIIFHPTDKTLYFEYGYDIGSQNFGCLKCRLKKSIVSAKLQKDENDETYFFLGKNEHVCQPSKISPIIQSLCDPNKTKRMKSDIDESKIVKKPDYELRPNKAGIPDRKLILRHPDDKSLCYQYTFDTKGEKFVCGRCMPKKIYVIAKLYTDEKNGGETFIVMGEKAHGCQPYKYQPL